MQLKMVWVHLPDNLFCLPNSTIDQWAIRPIDYTNWYIKSQKREWKVISYDIPNLIDSLDASKFSSTCDKFLSIWNREALACSASYSFKNDNDQS